MNIDIHGNYIYILINECVFSLKWIIFWDGVVESTIFDIICFRSRRALTGGSQLIATFFLLPAAQSSMPVWQPEFPWAITVKHDYHDQDYVRRSMPAFPLRPSTTTTTTKKTLVYVLVARDFNNAWTQKAPSCLRESGVADHAKALKR